MLTEKDYCDYDTSRELKELGFIAGLGEGNCGYCLYDDAWHDQVNRPLLYEAQKWLREEHQLHIEVRHYQNLWYEYELKEAEGKILAEGSAFKTYEDALSTAVYMATEHLKGK